MLLTPTLRKLNDAVRPVQPLMEGLEQRRMLAVDIQFSGPTDVNEGSGAGYGLAFSGLPQGATFTGWRIDWGDGSSPTSSGQQNPTIGHTYPDGESYATLCATLDYQDQSSYDRSYSEKFYVHVNNIAPGFGIEGDCLAAEGGEYCITLPAAGTYEIDPGDDTLTDWIVDWGDGNTDCISGQNPGGVGHTYADGNSHYTVSVRGIDEDGTWEAGNTLEVFVANVDPEMTFDGSPWSLDEGGTLTLIPGTFDPGDDTIYEWYIDWGDGSSGTYGFEDPLEHTYADDGSYEVQAVAYDEDGTYYAASPAYTLSVSNVEPSISLSGTPATLNEGEAFTLSRSYFDPGDDSIYEWHIDWGDGCGENVGDAESFVHTYENGGREFSVSAVAYDDDGTYWCSETPDVAVWALISIAPIKAFVTYGEDSSLGFVITRSGTPDWPITVYLEDPVGTAVEGLDYDALSRSVTIPAGAASVTAIANILDIQGQVDVEVAVRPMLLAAAAPGQNPAVVAARGVIEAYVQARRDASENGRQEAELLFTFDRPPRRATTVYFTANGGTAIPGHLVAGSVTPSDADCVVPGYDPEWEMYSVTIQALAPGTFVYILPLNDTFDEPQQELIVIQIQPDPDPLPGGLPHYLPWMVGGPVQPNGLGMQNFMAQLRLHGLHQNNALVAPTGLPDSLADTATQAERDAAATHIALLDAGDPYVRETEDAWLRAALDGNEGLAKYYDARRCAQSSSPEVKVRLWHILFEHFYPFAISIDKETLTVRAAKGPVGTVELRYSVNNYDPSTVSFLDDAMEQEPLTLPWKGDAVFNIRPLRSGYGRCVINVSYLDANGNQIGSRSSEEIELQISED